jgi:hypothetical protein
MLWYDYLIKRLKGDVFDVELLNRLEVNRIVRWIDPGKVESDRQLSTLTKLHFSVETKNNFFKFKN